MASEKTVFSLRMDDAVYEALRGVAEREKRSINRQIEIFIQYALEEHGKLNPDEPDPESQ